MIYSLRKFSILFCLILGFLGIESNELSQTCELAESKCSIHYGNRNEETFHRNPIVIKSIDPLRIFEPYSGYDLNLGKEGTVILICGGKENSFTSSNERSAPKVIHWSNVLNATCKCDSLFDYACSIFDANNLKCEKPHIVGVRDRGDIEVKPKEQKVTKKHKFRLLEAPLINGVPISELRILFSKTECLAKVVEFQSNFLSLKGSNQDWSTDKIYDGYACEGINNEKFYEYETQQFSEHFGNEINYESRKEYFVPAFLAPPKALSYMFGYMAKLYVNTAPQWNTINEGNWKVTQEFIPQLAYTKVMIGIHDHLKLKGEQVYLYNDGKGKKHLPVPLLFVAIVQDGTGWHGNAFITVNNPYANDKDVSDIGHSACSSWYYEASSPSWDYEKTSDGYYRKGYSFYCLAYEFLYYASFPYEDETFYSKDYKYFDLVKERSSSESVTHEGLR